MPTPAPKAFIFDVFGTVVDWRRGVAEEAARFYAERGIDADPFALADAWRDEYRPGMARVRHGERPYVPLDIIHRENLDFALEKLGLSAAFDAPSRDALNHAWEKLPAWPDSAEGLERLRAAGFVGTCSNGSVALMVRLARYAGLRWDAILGADTARDYKPSPITYRASAAALGLEPGEVMMVACHNNDLAAAAEAGLLTGWFPRPDEFGTGELIPADRDFDVMVDDIKALAARFGG